MKKTKSSVSPALAAMLGCLISAGANLPAGTVRAETVLAVTQYGYDANFRLQCTAVRMNMAITQPTNACTPATTIGANGPDRISQNAYDNAAQVLAVYRGVGTSSIIQYAYYNYTANGLKAFEIDANHNKTTLSYDGFDRLVKIQYPVTAVGSETASTTDYEAFGYDDNSNKTWWLRRKGVYIYYNYDNLNHEIPSYPGDNSVPNLYTGYDRLGRLEYKRSGNNTTSTPGITNAYDGLGRIVATTDFNNRTINYQYNAASGRTKLIFPEGNYVQYTLDSLNRVSSAGLNGTSSVLFSQVFDDWQRRTQLNRGMSSIGGTTTYAYDSLGRVTSLANDLNGTACDITWTFSGRNPANQITTWGTSTAVYDYVETATATTAKTYDGLNRDATIVAISGGYDTNGNLAKDGARTMTYDVYNRLVTATGTGTYAGLNLKLVYDTEGRLAKYSVDGGTTYTTFLYDGTKLIGEYNNAGTLIERYIHGSNTDEPVAWYHGLGLTPTDQRFYYQNQQGSVVAYTDSSGVLANYYEYGPYGEPKKADNTDAWPVAASSFGPRFRYTGQTAMSESGLYYYKARMYDPAFGRFLQTDPVGTKDDLNLYAYVGGDPINRSDTTGECRVDEQGKIVDCALHFDPQMPDRDRQVYLQNLAKWGKDIQQNDSAEMQSNWTNLADITIGKGAAKDPGTGETTYGYAVYSSTLGDLKAGKGGVNGQMNISSDMHQKHGGVDVKELAKTFFHELGHGTNDAMRAFAENNVNLEETAADFWGMTEGMRLSDIPEGTLVRDYRDQGASWTERRANQIEAKLQKARDKRSGH